jgi:acyl dehydratase
MTAAVAWADVEVGTELPAQSFPVDRASLVRYAGASGDFNVIHWNERVATSVGLPSVISHGMLTMALTGRVVSDWVGDPGAVVEFGTRFTRPVVVPDDDLGATVEVTAKVTAKDDDGTAVVTLTVMSGGVTVLGKARARVRLG